MTLWVIKMNRTNKELLDGIKRQDLDKVKKALENGAKIHFHLERNMDGLKKGMSPIMLAVSSCNHEIVDYLINESNKLVEKMDEPYYFPAVYGLAAIADASKYGEFPTVMFSDFFKKNDNEILEFIDSVVEQNSLDDFIFSNGKQSENLGM